MAETLIQAFVALFVTLDPIGQVPIFGALTHGDSRRAQRRTAARGVALAALVLYAFAFGGTAILDWLGVGLPAFRIAGGILLLLLAVDMLFARHSGLRATTASEEQEAEERPDISVFPLAIPLIAGPGAMTTVVLMMGRSSGDPWAIAGVLAVLGLVLGLVLLALLLAGPINALLGITGANVITRVLGIVLAALAVQFVLDGLRTAFPHL